jgi:2-phospho-L-lactate/phosphoenolpyruvate guanylyltransferase
MRTREWSVIVPLKQRELGKTRMHELPPALRQRLVVAMARDVRDAVLACPCVDELVVVTGDRRWSELLGSRRVRFVADARTDSLNDALRRGLNPGRIPPRPIAALAGDLPALRSSELRCALEAAAETGTLFVPDARGDGTTFFAARSPEGFWPRFGNRSRDLHREAGARELLRTGLAGLRQDVDIMNDLASARALGMGPHTAAVMSAIEDRGLVRTQLITTGPTSRGLA